MRSSLLTLFVLLLGCPTGTPGLPPLDPPDRFPDDDDSGDDDDADDDDADDDDAGDDDSGDDDDATGDDDDATGDDDDATATGPCPADMVQVAPVGESAFCIDPFEGALEVQDGAAWVPRTPYGALEASEVVRAVPADGVVPQSSISGAEAEAACGLSGKRLCTSAEWLAACRGPSDWTWPYGASHVADRCNDTYPGTHPVVDYFGTNVGIWNPASMNDPGINQQADTVEPGGAHAECVSDWGAFDMHGNLHEWVSDADGTFRGGFFGDAEINGPGCTYATTAHTMGYHDYSTGFRCCSDAAP